MCYKERTGAENVLNNGYDYERWNVYEDIFYILFHLLNPNCDVCDYLKGSVRHFP